MAKQLKSNVQTYKLYENESKAFQTSQIACIVDNNKNTNTKYN
jgi:hypothetical protein